MVKLSQFRAACLSAVLFSTIALPVWADRPEDIEGQFLFSIPTVQIVKAVASGGYDALFKEQIENVKDRVVHKVGVKLQQIFCRAGDLTTLSGDGTFTPVVHQYKNLGDFLLHFVLSDSQRGIAVKAFQAANWHYGFEKQIESAFRKSFGVGNLDDFIKLMAGKAVDSMLGTSPSPSSQPIESQESSLVRTRLTRGEIEDLKQTVSFEDGRSDALRRSYENWQLKDWTGFLMYRLGQQVNTATDGIIDWVGHQFIDQISYQENQMAREGAAIAAGALGTLIHPVIGITVAGVTRCQVTGLPTGVLESQNRLVFSLLEKAKSHTVPFIAVTGESVRKYHTETFTAKEVIFNVEGVEHEFTLIDKEEVTPTFQSVLTRLARPITKGVASIAETYKEGKEKGKRTKSFSGQKISYIPRSAPLLGAVNVVKTGTIGAAKAIGRGFGRLWGAVSSYTEYMDG